MSTTNVDDQEHKQLAFTLVELLFVVVVLGVMAAVIIPALLPRLPGVEEEEAQSPQLRVVGQQEQVRPAPLPGVPPVIASASIRVRVTARDLHGESANQGRYTARYSGEFTVRPTVSGEPLRLSIPLPDSAEEAEDVTLSLDGAGYTGRVDFRNLRVGIDGVHWAGPVPLAGDKGPLIAKVAFTAKGSGRVVLRLPEASRIRAVKADVDLVGLPALPVPASSLEPKTITENPAIDGFTYSWNYKNLVSHRPIIIELPVLDSPLARVVLMLRLVGLALFLFGCGFWYLAETYEAGRLSSFRWRHFLLLGLTYSLFFAVFVVSGFHGQGTGTSLLLSAVVALPLLVWHTASIIDWRFALKYTPPLVALTTGVVVNGVYGGEWRSYIFVGAAAFVIAYSTFTIEGMVQRQEARRERLEAELAARLRALEPSVQALAKADTEAQALLCRRKGSGFEELRGAVGEECGEARKLLDQYRDLDKCRLGMVQKAGIDRSADRQTISRGLWGMAEALEERLRRLEPLHDELADLLTQAEARDAKSRQKEKERRARAPAAQVHCIACGHGWRGSRHCPHCGARRPEELTCRKCGTTLPLPVHLLDPEAESQSLHCPNCGQCHSGASTDWFART